MWFVLTRPGGFGGRILNQPAAVGIGVISYSAYLWHLLLCEKLPAWIGSFPQNLVFIFAAAVLSYTLIEKAVPVVEGPLRTAHRAASRRRSLAATVGPVRPPGSREERGSSFRALAACSTLTVCLARPGGPPLVTRVRWTA